MTIIFICSLYLIDLSYVEFICERLNSNFQKILIKAPITGNRQPIHLVCIQNKLKYVLLLYTIYTYILRSVNIITYTCM